MKVLKWRTCLVAVFVIVLSIIVLNAIAKSLSHFFGLSETVATLIVMAVFGVIMSGFIAYAARDENRVTWEVVKLVPQVALQAMVHTGVFTLFVYLCVKGVFWLSQVLGLSGWGEFALFAGFFGLYFWLRWAAPNRPLQNFLLLRIPEINPPPIRHAFRRGDDFVVDLRRGHEFREPIAEIIGYRFVKVWFLEIVRKDSSVNRVELPTLSRKPEIESVMRAEGIPMAPESGG